MDEMPGTCRLGCKGKALRHLDIDPVEMCGIAGAGTYAIDHTFCSDERGVRDHVVVVDNYILMAPGASPTDTGSTLPEQRHERYRNPATSANHKNISTASQHRAAIIEHTHDDSTFTRECERICVPLSDGEWGNHVKRTIDLALAGIAAILLVLPAIAIAIAVRLTSPGPALYWSDRVGRGGRIFLMPKFRTMKAGTPAIATHLMRDAHSVLTPIGSFLRRTSLDEIPQVWSVVKGSMSFVGPRPALFNQEDLIALRREAGVDNLRPGITGWAQVNGRDELPIPAKVAFDREYLERQSPVFDLHIILKTAAKLLGDKAVSH